MTRIVVLNTLAYKQVIAENPTTRQADLLDEIKSAGFEYVEVRREYLKDGEVEIEQIAAKAKEKQLTLFYSIPDELFKNNELNPVVEQYFKEAKLLTSPQVKLTLGENDNFTKQQADQIAELVQRFSIKLLIENDQSKEKSNTNRLKAFMEQAAKYGLSLGLTFDIGNFVYNQEDPVESAKILAPYVHFVHIKNVKKSEAGLANTDIESGDLDIEAILRVFPEDITCAMEYSCGGQDVIQQKMAHERNEILNMSINKSEVTSK